MIGKVLTYNSKKRFGYILADDGREYFVHENEIKLPSKSLGAGYTVQFTPSAGFPKPQAVNVCLL